MIKTQNVSWSDVESTVKILSNKIMDSSQNFSSITTVSRGGLIPSRLLADALDIKQILVDQKIILYDSLFVDDIFDTGKTFDNVIAKVDEPSKFNFVTLFARRGMKFPKQLIYGNETRDDSYLIFPWDKLEYKRSLK
ncbi:MAG TPA: phosphoribosyltransferase [Nitrosopumilus sp.]|jgi:hypothetical protein|nr:phosphoribosyltransferase [Nitrosopumilus sp.]